MQDTWKGPSGWLWEYAKIEAEACVDSLRTTVLWRKERDNLVTEVALLAGDCRSQLEKQWRRLSDLCSCSRGCGWTVSGKLWGTGCLSIRSLKGRLVFSRLPEVAAAKKKCTLWRLMTWWFCLTFLLPGGEQRRGKAAAFFPDCLGGRQLHYQLHLHSASNCFFWYNQEPGKRLHLLIYTLSDGAEKQEQRLTVLLNKKDKHLSLQDTATHPGDSATYFCATRAQWSPGTGSLSPNLRLGWKPHSFSFVTSLQVRDFAVFHLKYINILFKRYI